MYDILYDISPKGVAKIDPHLLIVPQKEDGHVDGSFVPNIVRQEMFTIAQKAMQAFLPRGCKSLFYVERNGEKLQGVHHKHVHAMGVFNMPRTFFQKCLQLLRLFFAP